MQDLSTPAPRIAVLDRGFVYVGLVSLSAGVLTVGDASCIRRWGTTGGLGQLARTGATGLTKLDPAGTVHAPATAVIHVIDCAPGAWPALDAATVAAA